MDRERSTFPLHRNGLFRQFNNEITKDSANFILENFNNLSPHFSRSQSPSDEDSGYSSKQTSPVALVRLSNKTD